MLVLHVEVEVVVDGLHGLAGDAVELRGALVVRVVGPPIGGRPLEHGGADGVRHDVLSRGLAHEVGERERHRQGHGVLDVRLGEAEVAQRLHEEGVVVPLLRVVPGAEELGRLVPYVRARERHVAVAVLRVVVELDRPAGEEAGGAFAAHHPRPERVGERLAQPGVERRREVLSVEVRARDRSGNGSALVQEADLREPGREAREPLGVHARRRHEVVHAAVRRQPLDEPGVGLQLRRAHLDHAVAEPQGRRVPFAPRRLVDAPDAVGAQLRRPHERWTVGLGRRVRQSRSPMQISSGAAALQRRGRSPRAPLPSRATCSDRISCGARACLCSSRSPWHRAPARPWRRATATSRRSLRPCSWPRPHRRRPTRSSRASTGARAPPRARSPRRWPARPGTPACTRSPATTRSPGPTSTRRSSTSSPPPRTRARSRPALPLGDAHAGPHHDRSPPRAGLAARHRGAPPAAHRPAARRLRARARAAPGGRVRGGRAARRGPPLRRRVAGARHLRQRPGQGLPDGVPARAESGPRAHVRRDAGAHPLPPPRGGQARRRPSARRRDVALRRRGRLCPDLRLRGARAAGRPPPDDDQRGARLAERRARGSRRQNLPRGARQRGRAGDPRAGGQQARREVGARVRPLPARGALHGAGRQRPRRPPLGGHARRAPAERAPRRRARLADGRARLAAGRDRQARGPEPQALPLGAPLGARRPRAPRLLLPRAAAP